MTKQDPKKPKPSLEELVRFATKLATDGLAPKDRKSTGKYVADILLAGGTDESFTYVLQDDATEAEEPRIPREINSPNVDPTLSVADTSQSEHSEINTPNVVPDEISNVPDGSEYHAPVTIPNVVDDPVLGAGQDEPRHEVPGIRDAKGGTSGGKGANPEGIREVARYRDLKEILEKALQEEEARRRAEKEREAKEFLRELIREAEKRKKREQSSN